MRDRRDAGLQAHRRRPSRSSERARLLRQVGRVRRQHPIGRLDQQDARVARVDDAEVVLQGVVGDLAQRPGELDAGRPGADDDEGQPGLALGRIGLALGGLEGEQDAAADLGRVLDGLQARREGLPFVVAEVVMGRAGGDDQLVVRHLAVTEPHAAPLDVDRLDLAEQHPGVLLPGHHRAQRRGDLARRQAAGGHLVEQRLEEVEVAAVDQRDRDRRALERARRVEPAEAAADDHHPGCRVRHVEYPTI